MKPVTHVAEARERNAARALGAARQQLTAAEARLSELCGWRDDYQRRLKTAGGAGMNTREWSEYQIFLARLNDAIARQQEQVGQRRRDYDQTRLDWQSQRTRTLALDKVVERYRRDEIRGEQRREQRETDERGQRALTRD